MLTRHIVLPVSVERLWEALTRPSSWMGATVEWELVPGGSARFVDGEDGERRGEVGEVTPARRLSFRWWPVDDRSAESEVVYELEPDEGGTRLTVTERRVPPGAAPAQACAWAPWDTRAAGLFLALAGHPQPAVPRPTAPGRAGGTPLRPLAARRSPA